ncbi:hypothetical protein KAR91_08650 [Candidatus Pacearchaeota archaeon]|nr:hypothetical protein [Candidatus Pacearchaeota archaeon]
MSLSKTELHVVIINCIKRAKLFIGNFKSNKDYLNLSPLSWLKIAEFELEKADGWLEELKEKIDLQS